MSAEESLTFRSGILSEHSASSVDVVSSAETSHSFTTSPGNVPDNFEEGTIQVFSKCPNPIGYFEISVPDDPVKIRIYACEECKNEMTYEHKYLKFVKEIMN